jgi:hypothetical protein
MWKSTEASQSHKENNPLVLETIRVPGNGNYRNIKLFILYQSQFIDTINY